MAILTDKKLIGWMILFSIFSVAICYVFVFFRNRIGMEISWVMGFGSFLTSLILYFMERKQKVQDEKSDLV